MTFHFSVSISTNLLYKVLHSFMLSSKYNVVLKIRFYHLFDSFCKMMSAKYGNYASGAATECGQYYLVLVLFPQFFVTNSKIYRHSWDAILRWSNLVPRFSSLRSSLKEETLLNQVTWLQDFGSHSAIYY